MKTEEMESKSRQIYQQISALITGLRNDKKWASPEFNEFLLQVEKDFLNCQRKLDAKKYFVACFGALKAGKSTLMNALAEREVSPHGAGETTLHCSIILRADEKHPEGITLYRSKTNNDDEVGNKQRVEKLFAFFQDSIDKDEIKEEFDDKFYSLSKSEYILTDDSRHCGNYIVTRALHRNCPVIMMHYMHSRIFRLLSKQRQWGMRYVQCIIILQWQTWHHSMLMKS